MSLIVKTGQVSNLTTSTKTIGNNGNISSIQTYAFRINNLQCTAELPSNIGLSEEDIVKVVGEMKNGGLRIYAIKNETTGLVNLASAKTQLFIGISLIVFGILGIVIIIGIVVIPLGIYFAYNSKKLSKANSLLMSS